MTEFTTSSSVLSEVWTSIDIGEGLDVMGDGHGLLASRVELIEQAGYIRGQDGLFRHPTGRKLVYLNDESSRGSLPVETVEYGVYPSIAMLVSMKRQVDAGLAYAVDSNHNYKVWRWLEGRRVTMKHGDELVVDEFLRFEQTFGTKRTQQLKRELATFMRNLPSYICIKRAGEVVAVVAHAGIRDDMIGQSSEAIRDFCRFGPTAGLTPEGRPNRVDWTLQHKTTPLIIWGHVPHREAVVRNNTINLDTGGFSGHYLTLLRYPEMEVRKVKVPKSFVPLEDIMFREV